MIVPRVWVEERQLPLATANIKPDLIIVGQVTVDDVVPANPGPWSRQAGGSSLYALAGARLWLDAARIGLVARLGRDYPFDIEGQLRRIGVRHVALPEFAGEHLVEWLIYEPDGSRRSLPRNAAMLDVGGEGDIEAQDSVALRLYREKLLEIAPTADEIPPAWLPVPAVHLCPQAGDRHNQSLKTLRNSARWISVDPSPHYSRSLGPSSLAHWLEGATAFLPSEREVEPLLRRYGPEALALELHRAGFSEVLLKRGPESVILATLGAAASVPVTAAPVLDPTGAGDSFCGAYAACRVLGLEPMEAARRAAASAALVVSCRGVEAALQLNPPEVPPLP